jgi:endonuclease/exonuclease/phosphatase family metal-dependent hydrolase
MKVIFLNCQHGSLEKKLIQFVKSQIVSTDIFCLQEVTLDLQEKLISILDGYNFVFKNIKVNNKFTSNYGQTIFYKKNINFIKGDTLEVFKNRYPNYGFLQYIDIQYKSKKVRILNLHGLSQPGHKNDTKNRIKQSKNILSNLLLKETNILGGDFNLNPNTRSLRIIENSNLINLIKSFDIKTTRNEYAFRNAQEFSKKRDYKFYGKQLYADYCFVSPKIKVKKFEVPDIEISDHLPLILEFDI